MRALIIDHEVALVRSVRQTLLEEGFAVDASHDCDAGLEKSIIHHYDLIVLSLLLPEEKGFTLLRDLRRSGVTTPILVMVGSGPVAERVRCLDLGADGYVTTPINNLELAGRVRALVRRSRNHYDNTIRIHDLEIDTSTQTVRRGRLAIHLTRREYALLHFLASNRGKVCSRAMIVQHLYPDQTESRSNVVDVYIRFLRSKIDRGFAVRLIQTKWGKGYLLRDDVAVLEEVGA